MMKLLEYYMVLYCGIMSTKKLMHSQQSTAWSRNSKVTKKIKAVNLNSSEDVV